MRYLIAYLTLVFVLTGCSGEPDCVADQQYRQLIKQGKVGYSDLKDHITCYDNDGRPLR